MAVVEAEPPPGGLLMDIKEEDEADGGVGPGPHTPFDDHDDPSSEVPPPPPPRPASAFSSVETRPANPVPSSESSIEVKVLAPGKAGNLSMPFRMKPATLFDKLMQAWCSHHGIPSNRAVFTIGEYEVRADDTPGALASRGILNPDLPVTMHARPRKKERGGTARKAREGPPGREAPPTSAPTPASSSQAFAPAPATPPQRMDEVVHPQPGSLPPRLAKSPGMLGRPYPVQPGVTCKASAGRPHYGHEAFAVDLNTVPSREVFGQSALRPPPQRQSASVFPAATFAASAPNAVFPVDGRDPPEHAPASPMLGMELDSEDGGSAGYQNDTDDEASTDNDDDSDKRTDITSPPAVSLETVTATTAVTSKAPPAKRRRGDSAPAEFISDSAVDDVLEAPERRVSFKVVAESADGIPNVLKFTMGPETPLARLMIAWCHHHGLPPGAAHFKIGEADIKATDTPLGLAVCSIIPEHLVGATPLYDVGPMAERCQEVEVKALPKRAQAPGAPGALPATAPVVRGQAPPPPFASKVLPGPSPVSPMSPLSPMSPTSPTPALRRNGKERRIPPAVPLMTPPVSPAEGSP